MKHLKIEIFLFTSMVICAYVLAGCAGNANSDLKDSVLLSKISNDNSFETDSYVMEAPGGNVDYAVYEQYGLTYDEKTGCYLYNEKIVRYFNDPVAGASFTNFFTGMVDIEAKRDEKNNLIGIEECSQEEYDYHTEKYSNISMFTPSSTTQYSSREQNSEEWLKNYEKYDVTYNEQDNNWYYDGERIKILIDSITSYVYSTDKDGVCLFVSNNNEIEVISANDAESMLRSNSPVSSDGLTVEENN